MTATEYALEFLPQTDGHSVLHLGAPHLDHMVKFLRLMAKLPVKAHKL